MRRPQQSMYIYFKSQLPSLLFLRQQLCTPMNSPGLSSSPASQSSWVTPDQSQSGSISLKVVRSQNLRRSGRLVNVRVSRPSSSRGSAISNGESIVVLYSASCRLSWVHGPFRARSGIALELRPCCLWSLPYDMADPSLLLLPDLHMILGEESSDVYGPASSADLTMKTVCSDCDR